MYCGCQACRVSHIKTKDGSDRSLQPGVFQEPRGRVGYSICMGNLNMSLLLSDRPIFLADFEFAFLAQYQLLITRVDCVQVDPVGSRRYSTNFLHRVRCDLCLIWTN